MPRRTPIAAILLAPVALYLFMHLWKDLIVPLSRTVWRSNIVTDWRLGSDRAETRVDAISQMASAPVLEAARIEGLLTSLEADASEDVRRAALAALGQIGAQASLTDAAIAALGSLTLSAPTDPLLNAVITAVGQAVANNRFPDEPVQRIARILEEKHGEWMYSQTLKVLGQIGAAQPLPVDVLDLMNLRYAMPVHRGERENLANAFREIAKGGRLAASSAELLANSFAAEPSRRIRTAILFSLAYATTAYPAAVELITAATTDPEDDIVRAAEHGLRIIEAERLFGNTDPLSLALDRSRPVGDRLQGLRVIQSARIDAAAFPALAALAHEDDKQIAIASLGPFHHLARDPGIDFDRRVLIPELEQAMSNTDPRVREAAYAALSTIAVHRPAYLQAADFPARLEAGARDPDPKVRVIAFVAMLRAAPDTSASDAIIARGMSDADTYVRRNAAGWLASDRIRTARREDLIGVALNDPDPSVRNVAESSQASWNSRKRAWPVELWRTWRAGEYAEVGKTILVAVTVAAPVVIGVVFLLYYTARLIAYVVQRRWRALLVLPVVAAWAAASYAMFLLYFTAGHIGHPSPWEFAAAAAILWAAISVYAALGWGMHFAVRR